MCYDEIVPFPYDVAALGYVGVAPGWPCVVGVVDCFFTVGHGEVGYRSDCIACGGVDDIKGFPALNEFAVEVGVEISYGFLHC